jgi:hypothetical protein
MVRLRVTTLSLRFEAAGDGGGRSFPDKSMSLSDKLPD